MYDKLRENKCQCRSQNPVTALKNKGKIEIFKQPKTERLQHLDLSKENSRDIF